LATFKNLFTFDFLEALWYMLLKKHMSIYPFKSGPNIKTCLVYKKPTILKVKF